jgi:hypothetical protein
MIDSTAGTVTLSTPFSITLTVSTESGASGAEGGSSGTVSDIPRVTTSLTDPGVTITTAPGSVTIAGKYIAALKTKWHWLDSEMKPVSGDAPPAVGAFSKVTGVDSPTSLTNTVVYTITSSAGTDTFTHTVTLGSFSTIADLLTGLLASVK